MVSKPEIKAITEESTEPLPKTHKPEPTNASEQGDRPSFDLRGSTGETHAGKGLELGADAMETEKDGVCQDRRPSGHKLKLANVRRHDETFLASTLPQESLSEGVS
jgi:hypothetical protein